MKVINIKRGKALIEVDSNYVLKEYTNKNGRIYFPLLISKKQYEKFNLIDTWVYGSMDYGKDYIIVRVENLKELGI